MKKLCCGVVLVVGMLACGGALEVPIAPPSEADAMQARPVDGSTWKFSEGPGQLEIGPLPADPAAEIEPNDTLDEATRLSKAGAATGSLSGNKDKDHFYFKVSEVGSWSFVVESDASVSVKAMGAAGKLGGFHRDLEGRQVLHGVHLLPGEVTIVVSGSKAANYSVRAVRHGSHDKTVEREPNQDLAGAHSLTVGVARSGWSVPRGDADLYRFSLTGPSYVRLHWRFPGEVKLLLRDLTGAQGVLNTQALTGEGHWDGWLESGDYTLRLSCQVESLEPYQVGIEQLDPFHLPADLEPNDEPVFARPLPPSLSVKGTVSGPADSIDHFRMPVSDRDAKFTITGVTPELKLDVRGPEGEVLISETEVPAALEGVIPAGQQALLSVSKGDYDLGIAVAGVAAADRAAQPAVSVSLSGPTEVAAFREIGQSLELTALLDGQGMVWVETRTSTEGWGVPALQSVLVSGRQEHPIAVLLPEDLGDTPVYVTVAVRTDPFGIPRTATHRIDPVCGARLVQPTAHWPIPQALLGGVNVARLDFGATLANDDVAQLFDGVTPKDAGVSIKEPVTIELAGSGPQVAGFLLDTQGKRGNLSERPYKIELSADGKRFDVVAEGSLPRAMGETAIVLPTVVSATHARFTFPVEKTFIGEIKVVAAPGTQPLGKELNLARPGFGGHFVRTRPHHSGLGKMLGDEAAPQSYRIDPGQPLELVLAFEHGRSVRLSRLEWDQPEASRPLRTVMSVSVSDASPVGPWTVLGSWALPGENETGVFEMQGTAARYVKLSNVEDGRSGMLAARIRAIEAPLDGRQRTAIGEYGKYNSAGPRELSEGVQLRALGGRADPGGQRNETPETATSMTLGVEVGGAVSVGEDIDVYRVEVPEGENHLAVRVVGDPSVNVELSLATEEGLAVPMQRIRMDAAMSFEATVAPGVHFLTVSEPPRSIALLWDQSGSVGAFVPQIYSAVTEFIEVVQPGREVANLYPFQGKDGAFLSEEWLDNPLALQGVLNGYDRKDASSDAESALLDAVREMEPRIGTKAILLLTDAETHSSHRTPELWDRFAVVRPRVFTMELHIGKVPLHQDLMQGWSDVDAGHYSHFSSAGVLDLAFARASCHLRRPAGYSLNTVARVQAPPDPGAIEVIAGENSLDGYAVELILDASGSMLKKIGGKARIDIARTVLSDLIEDTIPAKAPLALRVFGHKKAGSCRTDLEVPLAPLNPASMEAVLQGIRAKNLAKTPIADSLLAVEKDLAKHQGPKLVVLLTDGEETCNGDPAAAIETLVENGVDVRMNIVGFAIDDGALRTDFQNWARSGGGVYIDAADEAELGEAMLAALSPKVQVLDAAGVVVVEGTVGGGALEVPPGTYTLKVLSSPVQTRSVEVLAGTTAKVDLTK